MNRPDASEKRKLLVNKLSVADARHIVLMEGGDLDAKAFLFRALVVLGVAIASARAVWVGAAEAQHLITPMVAQYLVLLFAIPIAYAVCWHPAMRKDALGSLRLLLILAAIWAGIAWWRGGWNVAAILPQVRADSAVAWEWVYASGMAWPTLFSALGMLVELPGRVRFLYKHGPPFSAVGLGCAMRLLMLIFGVTLGVFLIPAVEKWGPAAGAWALWLVIVLGDAGAVWMHWDIQRMLKRYDAREPSEFGNTGAGPASEESAAVAEKALRRRVQRDKKNRKKSRGKGLDGEFKPGLDAEDIV